MLMVMKIRRRAHLLYQTPLTMRMMLRGSQAQPLEISSSDKSDSEPRRSSRIRRVTKNVQSQLWQIEKGLIPTPGARAKVRALNKK
jgi:hypothetical protein